MVVKQVFFYRGESSPTVSHLFRPFLSESIKLVYSMRYTSDCIAIQIQLKPISLIRWLQQTVFFSVLIY